MGIEKHRGTSINDVEGLDHMLLLAIRIGRDTPDIGYQSICQQVMGAGRSRGRWMGCSG